MNLTYQQQLTYLRNFKNSVDKRGLNEEQICTIIELYSLQKPVNKRILKNSPESSSKSIRKLVRKGLLQYVNLHPLQDRDSSKIYLTRYGEKWVQILLYAFDLSDPRNIFNPRDVSEHKDEIVMTGLRITKYMEIFSGKNRIEVLFRIYKEPHLTKGELEQKIGKKISHSLKQEEENTLIISSKKHSTAVKKYTVSEWTSEVLRTILSPSHILTPFLPS